MAKNLVKRRDLSDEEIGILQKAIPILYELKTSALENAVNECEGVGANYKIFKKMSKSLKKTYEDYKNLLTGLDYLAFNSDKYTRRVNAALKKFKNSRLYFEIVNGNDSEDKRPHEF